MPILGSLLPGLREVRAPLAAGYLWLVTLATLLVDGVPLTPARGSVVEKVYALSSWLGSAPLLAVVSFLAYLTGLLSVAFTSQVLSWTAQQHKRSDAARKILAGRITTLSDRGLLHLQSLVEEKLASQLSDSNNQQFIKTSNAYPESRALFAALSSGVELTERRELVAMAVETAPHVRAILDDLVLVPNRLLGKEPEKFSVFDRQVSEGEFRAALSLPLLCLSLAGAIQTHRPWIVAIGVVFAAMLLMQARSRTITAYDQLADFMRSGSVTSGVSAEIDQAAIRLQRTSLSPKEIDSFRRRAQTAEAGGQLDAAVSWYRVPAAAGDVESNEKVCDLTRVAKSIYRDSDTILEPLLVEGSEFSGRLSLEALELQLARFDRPASGSLTEQADFDSNMRWAIWLVALRGLKHQSSTDLAHEFLEAAYMGWGDGEALTLELGRVKDGLMGPVAFLTQHPPSESIPPSDLRAIIPKLRVRIAALKGPST